MKNSIVTAVTEQLSALPENMQQRVLEFVQALRISERRSVSGKQLLRFAGLIPPDDLQLMRQAIALQHRLTLISRDNYFREVEELMFEVW